MRVTAAAASLVVAALLLAAPLADAQPQGGAPTVTRLVKAFLVKEAALGSAVRAGDSSALRALLTDDFELRDAASVGVPVARDEWLRNAIAARAAGGEIHGMAVHDFGSVAIASFTQDVATRSVLVVDVWRSTGADWKLAVRYTGPAGASASPPREHEGVIPKKY